MVLKRGFTLVELLIVMAIIAMMVVIVIGILDPIALSNKGYDARRKKDVKRIGVAMEEYYNDRGCFPQQAEIDALDCGSDDFAPWLSNWPCDPSGEKYLVMSINSDCPNQYRIYTKLRNQSDADIPVSISSQVTPVFYNDVPLGINDYNYGSSSSNVSWYEKALDPSCNYYVTDHSRDSCFNRPADDPTRCGRSFLGSGSEGCSGSNCFARNDCNDICQVSCCGAGCI